MRGGLSVFRWLDSGWMVVAGWGSRRGWGEGALPLDDVVGAGPAGILLGGLMEVPLFVAW